MEDMLLRLTNYSSSPMTDNIILLITYISFITLMLLPYLSVLNSKKVILGSQSKSRNQLMTAQGLKYTVIPSTFPEDLDKSIYAHPSQYNMVIVIQPRIHVWERLRS
jgi:septum formation protein